jgi:DNA-binding LacI/PurR family transcriptional regulator
MAQAAGPGGAPRRPRLADVAERAGVSTASVSLVLRDAPGPSAETRERVRQAAAELGYRPDRTASLLARKQRSLLGVTLVIGSAYHAELVEELHVAAERRGYDLVLSAMTRSRSERDAIETLQDFRCDALVLLGSNASATELAELARHAPVVVVGRRVRAAGVDTVRVAEDQGVEAALAHLVQLGHRKIAYVDGGPGPVAADRRRGYSRSMRRHGLGDLERILPGDSADAGGRAAAQLLGERLPCTAVIAYNDATAIGLLDVLTRAGVDVPEALSVVGYDDSTLSRLAHVDLTTVSQDPQRQAEHAIAAAVGRLEGGSGGSHDFVLAPRLVVRGTTGAAPR